MLSFRTLFLAPLAALALADARPVDIDKARSEITFTAKSRFVDAHGSFAKWDAEVALDPAAFERSTVRFTIDAASITTQSDRRDTHLKTADFFDVAKYPTITFVSKSIATSSPAAGTITGDLTMHGVTRSVQVPVTAVVYENGRGHFRGAFAVARRDYGLSYDSRMNPIADTVQVQFDMNVVERRSAQ